MAALVWARPLLDPEEGAMSLKRYDAVVNGVDTILLLNAEDASKLGDAVTPVGQKPAAAATPQRKAAAKPRNKAAAKPANKAPDAVTPVGSEANGGEADTSSTD